MQINVWLQTPLHSSIFRFLAHYGSIEWASRQILIFFNAARDIAPENLLKTGKFGGTSKFHWIYLRFSFKLALSQFLNFLFCGWWMQINFQFQTRLYSSIFNFLVLYGSIECASRQILIRQIVARDMDFKFRYGFQMFFIFLEIFRFLLIFRKSWFFRFSKICIFQKKCFFEIFKIDFLLDEKIIFTQNFLLSLIYISTDARDHLEHPGTALHSCISRNAKKNIFFPLIDIYPAFELTVRH